MDPILGLGMAAIFYLILLRPAIRRREMTHGNEQTKKDQEQAG